MPTPEDMKYTVFEYLTGEYKGHRTMCADPDGDVGPAANEGIVARSVSYERGQELIREALNIDTVASYLSGVPENCREIEEANMMMALDMKAEHAGGGIKGLKAKYGE